MRAASMDFQTARILGVRANRVIAMAVLLSGALAAVVAVMLTVQTPLVTPDFALRDTIIVLAGVVLGGMNRPIPATLGGFAIGFASGLLGGALPTNQSQYLPTFLFAAVILVLLVRPGGIFARRVRSSAYEARRSPCRSSSGPALLVVAAALLGTAVSISTQSYFTDALVKVAIVVALYVFIGNSGVLSFGHISFVAVGAWTAGVLSVPASEKPAIMPSLAHVLRDRTVGNFSSLAARRGRRRDLRARRRAAADAPLGARGRDRDLRRARDHAQPAALRGEDRPGAEHLLLRAGDDRAAAGGDRRARRDRRRVRLRAQPVRPAAARDARGPAAARAVGVSVYRQRLIAFALSGLLAGLAGGLYVHLLPLQHRVASISI